MRKRAWRGRCIGRSRVASPAAGVRDCAPGSSSEQWSTTRALDRLRRCLLAEAQTVPGSEVQAARRRRLGRCPADRILHGHLRPRPPGRHHRAREPERRRRRGLRAESSRRGVRGLSIPRSGAGDRGDEVLGEHGPHPLEVRHPGAQRRRASPRVVPPELSSTRPERRGPPDLRVPAVRAGC